MITEGYLARHYEGRRGGRDPALLDVAQDYALKVIADAELFDMGLALKGGTALRKYRAGTAGRFSTDLDFAASDAELGELLLGTLQGAVLYDVRFIIEDVTDGRRGKLRVQTPLGSPLVDARIEVGKRPPWLTPQRLQPVPFPVHRAYEFVPVIAPVMALEETLAEKLAAFRRRALVRDLYDLAWFSRLVFDIDLVRKLTYLKVFVDVVEDSLGQRGFDPRRDLLRSRRESEFEHEDIGLLRAQIDIPGWLEILRNRFEFLAAATAEELRWAECNPRDAHGVGRAIAGTARR